MADSVGEQLKQARTERGLTLEQVTQAIHLRKAYLEALENDQRGELPSLVQGRGYLRLYAGFLNLPYRPLLDAWEGKPQPEILEQSTPGETTGTPALKSPGDEVSSPPPAPVPAVPTTYRAAQSAEANSSQAIFIEIGQKLQQQRDALGLSRAEVERYTRLRQHYLQAMEEGRMDKLPSPVQGRGMLSNYAAFLNLNEDQLLLRFAEGLQQRRLERIPPPEAQPALTKKRPVRQASPLRQFLTPDVLFGVIVVGAILFFAIRTAASISALRAQESQPTARAIAEVLLMTATSSPGPLETVIEAGAVALSPSPASTAVAAESNTGTSETVAAIPFPANGRTLAATAQVTIAPINDDPLQVYIIARQRAWLRITVDNKELFNGRVVPGNAYAYSGAKRIELLTGNAAALQVFFNQQDLGTLGIAGQVAELIFLPEGIQTPTATQTFTPTVTPLVTVTPTPGSSPQVTQTITPFVP
jgi:cytoskeleton protein RodZ